MIFARKKNHFARGIDQKSHQNFFEVNWPDSYFQMDWFVSGCSGERFAIPSFNYLFFLNFYETERPEKSSLLSFFDQLFQVGLWRFEA